MIKDTLTGTLHYDDERVAMGTMAYKHVSLANKLDEVAKGIAKLNVNLKLLTASRRSLSWWVTISRTFMCTARGTVPHGSTSSRMSIAASPTCQCDGLLGADIR